MFTGVGCDDHEGRRRFRPTQVVLTASAMTPGQSERPDPEIRQRVLADCSRETTQ
jgi:hypothetical protein